MRIKLQAMLQKLGAMRPKTITATTCSTSSRLQELDCSQVAVHLPSYNDRLPYAMQAQRNRCTRGLLSLLACAAAGLCAAYVTSSSQAPLAGAQDKVLLVIAHPDDETMFFSPTLLALRSKGAELHVLCLSQGNAYGLGAVRCKELEEACKLLQVPRENVRCVDNPDLQDGMSTPWPAPAVQREVQDVVDLWQVTKVITFDSGGVSGHINHLGTYQGVREYLSWRKASGLPDLPAWSLESVNLERKYLGCLDCLPSALLRGKHQVLLLNTTPWVTIRAMMQHRSQLVWYRWLFILFSRYTWVNTLQPFTADWDPAHP